eukprot:scaffold15177_cov69-Phaeocystis_antarctica.AAC.3
MCCGTVRHQSGNSPTRLGRLWWAEQKSTSACLVEVRQWQLAPEWPHPQRHRDCADGGRWRAPARWSRRAPTTTRFVLTTQLPSRLLGDADGFEARSVASRVTPRLLYFMWPGTRQCESENKLHGDPKKLLDHERVSHPDEGARVVLDELDEVLLGDAEDLAVGDRDERQLVQVAAAARAAAAGDASRVHVAAHVAARGRVRGGTERARSRDVSHRGVERLRALAARGGGGRRPRSGAGYTRLAAVVVVVVVVVVVLPREEREEVDQQRPLREGLARVGRQLVGQARRTRPLRIPPARQLLEAESALAHEDDAGDDVAAREDARAGGDALLRHDGLQLRHL